METVLLTWLGLVGLSFGSFVNALVWRIHTKKNFVSERSICIHCKHVLAWYDLIPIFSWLSLRGRCRYCKKPIEDSPVVEATAAILFAASYYWWPLDLGSAAEYVALGFWLVQLVGLIALVVYDFRWLLLPNKILLPMTGLAVAQRIFEAVVVTQTPEPIKEMILGSLAGGGVFYLLYQVSAGRWIGGGDVKLGFYMGLLLGPLKVGLAIMVGFYSASIILLPLMVLKKVGRKSKIPFGPFLIAGLVALTLFSATIISWYERLYGLS